MLNFQVDDLDASLDTLTAAGATVDPKRKTPNMAGSAGSLIQKATAWNSGSPPRLETAGCFRPGEIPQSNA